MKPPPGHPEYNISQGGGNDNNNNNTTILVLDGTTSSSRRYYRYSFTEHLGIIMAVDYRGQPITNQTAFTTTGIMNKKPAALKPLKMPTKSCRKKSYRTKSCRKTTTTNKFIKFER